MSVRRGGKEVQFLGTYPNPASRQATLRYAVPEGQEVRISLYDRLGRKVPVVSGKKESRHKRRSMSQGWSDGVYFMRPRTESATRTGALWSCGSPQNIHHRVRVEGKHGYLSRR
ncbi:MAG: T9SS type A sorting domain-containing protein [Salinibacter sp.]